MSQHIFQRASCNRSLMIDPVYQDSSPNALLYRILADYECLLAERNCLEGELENTQKEVTALKTALNHSTLVRIHLEHEMLSSIQERYEQITQILEQTEAKTKSLIQAIPDLMFCVNSERIVVDYYPDKQELHFLETENVIGKKIQDVFPQDLATWTEYYLKITLETGEVQMGEYVVKGDDKWHHYEARYVKSGKDEVLAIVRDITQRKQAEANLRVSEIQERERALQLEKTLKDLQQAQAQLIQAEKMSSLGQMMTEIAHEIKNPISSIYGNLTYIDQDIQTLMELFKLYQQNYPEPLPEIQEFITASDVNTIINELPQSVEFMRLGANRLYDLALSLRNFSRLDSQEMVSADLHIGLDGTLKILHNQLKSKGNHAEIEVIKDYGELPLVKCYPNQLNQVFMNLLANAIDALENQPVPRKIIIKTDICKRHPDFLVEDAIRISISDNGPGIPKSVQDQIFNPFFTTKPMGKGTGLGLSIAHQIIVEKHQGRLKCTSQEGQGTTFEIILPLGELFQARK
ncbi:Sensor kinase CckA [Planktothrix tepida]|uniref:histidine kinase n=2 Tax=Planktothrix TaxID=54304 RepID=A0A1J1LG41_9CYAN